MWLSNTIRLVSQIKLNEIPEAAQSGRSLRYRESKVVMDRTFRNRTISHEVGKFPISWIAAKRGPQI